MALREALSKYHSEPGGSRYLSVIISSIQIAGHSIQQHGLFVNGHASFGFVLALHGLQLFFRLCDTCQYNTYIHSLIYLIDAVVSVFTIHLEPQEKQFHEANLLRVFCLQEDIEGHLQLFLVVVVFNVDILRKQHLKTVELHEQVEYVLHIGVFFRARNKSDQQFELFLFHIFLLQYGLALVSEDKVIDRT